MPRSATVPGDRSVRPDTRSKPVGPLVTCVGVGHTFGAGTSAVVAVYGVNLTIAAGARIVLTGPSGSGKSTLLHMLAGLEPPTAGQLSWPGLGGHPLDRRPPGQPCRVGMIFQGPSLLPALTVLENVTLPLLLAGTDAVAATAAAMDALDRVGIADLQTGLPEQLSGGQAQRVAVARALAARPALILADEPAGQLDHATAATVIDALLATCDELGAALVVSTHDPLVAARLPQEWVMHDGYLPDPAPVSSTNGAPA
jgi:ABC-type lipoprotein export system ATPase subunit